MRKLIILSLAIFLSLASSILVAKGANWESPRIPIFQIKDLSYSLLLPAIQGTRIRENTVRIRFAASAGAKVIGDWDGDGQDEIGNLTGNQVFNLVISSSRGSEGDSYVVKGQTSGRLSLKADDHTIIERNFRGIIGGTAAFDDNILSFTGLEFKANGDKGLKMDLILQGFIDISGDDSISPIDILKLTGEGMLYF